MTPEEMTLLLEKGHSMSEISVMCDKSRGAVAGAIYRYRQKKGNAVHVLEVVKKSRSIKSMPVFKNTVDFQGVVERGDCRYITGDPAVNPSYCSSKAVKGAYCEYHYSVCHRKNEVGVYV